MSNPLIFIIGVGLAILGVLMLLGSDDNPK